MTPDASANTRIPSSEITASSSGAPVASQASDVQTRTHNHLQLTPLALSPHQYMHISQHLTQFPKVYCGPTVIAMGYSPFYRDWAFYHPDEYVENFAKHLKTSTSRGTSAQELLDGMNYLNTHHDLADRWSALEYQGIHNVSRNYYANDLNRPSTPDINDWVRSSLSKGSLVVAHLGWYKENTLLRSMVRHGGHYVLVTGVFSSASNPAIRYVQVLDPLDYEGEGMIEDIVHTRHYMLELRPFSEAQKAYTLKDTSKQFADQPVGNLLYQPEPTPGKKEKVMPVLEGVMILQASPKKASPPKP